MPSIIEQIREQRPWEQPKKSSSTGFIIGTIAAFAAGIALVIGWGSLPSLSIKGLTASTQQQKSAAVAAPTVAPAKQPDISIPTGGRMGAARESKILNGCITDYSKLGSKLQKKDVYDMMLAGSQMRLDPTDEGGVAFMWAELADCVYRQNGWALCDPDNRALAVETVSMLTRYVNAASAKPSANKEQNGGSGMFFTSRTFADVRAEVDGRRVPTQQQKLQSARSIKDRVFATLKTRAQEGRFIASDFGFLTPGEVTQVVKSAKPTSDACSARQ